MKLTVTEINNQIKELAPTVTKNGYGGFTLSGRQRTNNPEVKIHIPESNIKHILQANIRIELPKNQPIVLPSGTRDRGPVVQINFTKFLQPNEILDIPLSFPRRAGNIRINIRNIEIVRYTENELVELITGHLTSINFETLLNFRRPPIETDRLLLFWKLWRFLSQGEIFEQGEPITNHQFQQVRNLQNHYLEQQLAQKGELEKLRDFYLKEAQRIQSIIERQQQQSGTEDYLHAILDIFYNDANAVDENKDEDNMSSLSDDSEHSD